MKLKELIEKSTPLPWVIGADPTSIVATQAGRPYTTTIAQTLAYKSMREPNARLIVHAVKMLPKLVAALEKCDGWLKSQPNARSFKKMKLLMAETAAVLDEANEPEVSK